MYLIFIISVLVVTATLPLWAGKALHYYGVQTRSAPAWIALLAAATYVAALIIPDIGLTAETDTFQQHFVGGGLYTTALFVYLIKLIDWRPERLIAFMALFAWTSALGTVNELLEFVLVKLNITSINLTDTAWDIAANTSGMLVGYLIWQGCRLLAKPARSKPVPTRSDLL